MIGGLSFKDAQNFIVSSFEIMSARKCDRCFKTYAQRQSLYAHKKRCKGASSTIIQRRNFISHHSQFDSQKVDMGSFPTDNQFERCVAATNESSDAVQWKDLPRNVIYRVKPQGLIETTRGKDTLIELVDRENKQVKVWAPPAVVQALCFEDYPDRDKTAYIRPLDFSKKRKGFETVFLRDDQPSKKPKIELPEQTLKTNGAYLLKTMKRIAKQAEKMTQTEKGTGDSTNNTSKTMNGVKPEDTTT